MTKIILLLLISNIGLAIDSDNIKTCLAISYTFQENYRTKNNHYANSIEELASVKSTPYCQSLELEIIPTPKEKFLIKASHQGEIWTVDQTKTIRKI